MKNRERGGNAILAELILAVLLFMLCACVLVRVFVGAAKVSREAEVRTRALYAGQNIADEVYLAADAAKALEELGFSLNADGVWEKAQDELTLSVRAEIEETDSGVMRRARVEVRQGNDCLLELPCSRFIPGEAQ